jgi:hypothetical protein
MERQNAIATVMYLQKAIAIVPTTGQEWDAVRAVLQVIEGVANGRVIVEVKDVQQVTANGRDAQEELPAAAH